MSTLSVEPAIRTRQRRWRPIVLVAAAVLALAAGGAAITQHLAANAAFGGPPRVGQDVPVTADDLTTAPANNSPQVVADPQEPRFVVIASRRDAPQFGCALEVSGDGGASWVRVNPVPVLPSGAEKCYAPQAAFDARGVLNYLFVGLHGIGNSPMGVFLTTSSDAARSFSPPRAVLGPGQYQVQMAIDRSMGSHGRMQLVWLKSTENAPLGGFPLPPNPIEAAYSDDGGRTFSTPTVISSDASRPLSVAPALALGPDHAVNILYYDLEQDVRDYRGLEGPTSTGHWSLVLTRSTDGGQRYGHEVVVDDGLVPPARVMLIYTMPPASLVSDHEGNLYAAWYDARNGDWDVFLRASYDGGRTWGRLERLNDDPLRDGRNQYLPHLSVAPNGRIDAIFFDRRRDPLNIRNDTYYTFSTDRGRTFSKNLRLTSRSSDTRIGQRYLVPSATGQVEFGSRLGSLSRNQDMVAAWADTRNAFGSHPQTIFAAMVQFPGASDTEWGPGVVVAVLLGVAALAMALPVVVPWKRLGRGRRR